MQARASEIAQYRRSQSAYSYFLLILLLIWTSAAPSTCYLRRMNTHTLDTTLALPDADLLARLPLLAAGERSAAAELVAHLAALRLRPSLYAALGYGTLFAYCRRVLRLSEDAASNRIHAAKACLKFPVLLDLLASGELSLSAIRMLRPHLTAENLDRVLARARNARRVDIERLIAELAPRPDVATSVRKLPMPGSVARAAATRPTVRVALPSVLVNVSGALPGIGAALARASLGTASASGADTGCPGPVSIPALSDAAATPPMTRRPVVQPLSPERYRVQFTMGQESHDLLRRLQTLLRREVPDGDAGAIFERALRVLHEKVESARFGKTRPPETTAKAPRSGGDRAGRRGAAPSVGPAASVESAPPIAPTASASADGGSAGAYVNRIRPGADPPRGRYVPKAVRRAVWYRDRAQCAFISASGVRCAEQDFLELHHIQPFALKGSTTVENLALRCRRHNAYEAELVFGVVSGPKAIPRSRQM